MATQKRIIPSLGIGKLSDGDLLTYAHQRAVEVAANAAFATVIPTVSKITTAADDFEAAMTAQRPGDEASTTAKNNARQLLEDLLFAQSVACAR